MRTIYQIDAFTSELFKGNPAGVMIADENLSVEQMQQIAMEMNLSETAFIFPREHHFDIRYFTPACEVSLCGHATLASSHLLYESGVVPAHKPILFKARGGDLTIKKSGEWLAMDFPAYPLIRSEIYPDFRETIGFDPLEMWTSIYDWVIAIAPSEKEIMAARPNFERMKLNGLGHLMITSQENTKGADFVVRCFAPLAGINEDPVTGSAHCALTPLWAEKLGKKEMESFQLSQRTGRLKVKLLSNRVEIMGQAVTVFKAEM